MSYRLAPVLGIALAAVLVPGVAGAKPVVQGAKPLPLSARVIQRFQFPGFGPFGGPPDLKHYATAKAWVDLDTGLAPAQASAQVARLEKEGFKALVSEQLGSTEPNQGGLSWVMQLGSAPAARAEVAANARDARSSSHAPKLTYAAFAVSTIPDAHGYHLGGPDGAGDNVVFADGPFVYLVGDGWPKTNKAPPARTALIAAATKLYERVRGHPAA